MCEQGRGIMFDPYLWIKAFHLLAVIFWMAGLLILPRFYVYHSKAEPGGELEKQMVDAERRIMKIIMNPAMIAAFVLGLILVGYNWEVLKTTIWLPAKLVFVTVLLGFHGFLSKIGKEFAAGNRPKSEKFFRMINEIPALIAILVVILVIVRPF